jgi:hypothetical protein
MTNPTSVLLHAGEPLAAILSGGLPLVWAHAEVACDIAFAFSALAIAASNDRFANPARRRLRKP